MNKTAFGRTLLRTDTDTSTIFIRWMVGAVFLSEGIQKFLFPELLGSGRFLKIGIPFSDFFGPFVGIVEILAGLLLLMGFLTRFASILLGIVMLVAIFTTKTAVLQNEGFWPMLHGSRTDWSMLLGCIFLLYKGGGKWSMDLVLHLKNRQ